MKEKKAELAEEEKKLKAWLKTLTPWQRAGLNDKGQPIKIKRVRQTRNKQ